MILTIPNFLAQSVKEQILLRNGTNHTIYSLQVVKNEVELLSYYSQYGNILSRADAVYFISICQASFMQVIDDQALPSPGQ